MPTLEWIGKDKVINHDKEVPFKILEPKYTYDIEGKHAGVANSENMIIHGDNLLALKSLLPKYEGKIKCIYIDPPYNTGNENWVYNDNVNDPQMKKWLGEVVGKEGEDLSRHDKWLCMMYPRLKLLRRLMADDGAIFISIDDNEQANLKLICDEIFGAGNFVANIAVISNLKGRSDGKYIANAHESLIIYKKKDFVTNGVGLPEEYKKEYKQKNENGYYRLLGLRKRGSNSKKEDRPNMFYPIFYNKEEDVISLEKNNDNDVEILPHLSDGTDGCWRWGKDTTQKNLQNLQVQLVKTRNEYDVFQIDYLNNGTERRIKPKSFWSGTEFAAETGTLQVKEILGAKVFNTPKSTGLLQYCFEQATEKDSIILDSFAGSGTTAHAVLSMNKADGGKRKFICVEMMDYADTITAERVKRVINGYGEGKKAVAAAGGSFTYYELGEPLFDTDGNLNPKVGVEKIREYIWYMETQQTLPVADGDNAAFLGTGNNTAYYFYYDEQAVTTLNHEFLASIKTQAESYVIYADNCTLSAEFMAEHHITFKKIPRDIARL